MLHLHGPVIPVAVLKRSRVDLIRERVHPARWPGCCREGMLPAEFVEAPLAQSYHALRVPTRDDIKTSCCEIQWAVTPKIPNPTRFHCEDVAQAEWQGSCEAFAANCLCVHHKLCERRGLTMHGSCARVKGGYISRTAAQDGRRGCVVSVLRLCALRSWEDVNFKKRNFLVPSNRTNLCAIGQKASRESWTQALTESFGGNVDGLESFGKG